MKAINTFFIYLFSLCLLTPSYLLAQNSDDLSKNKERYTYDVSYKRMKVGEMVREFQHGEGVITANTSADLSFLFYHFGGSQVSQLYWDEASQRFQSKHFARKSVGFKGETTEVDFLQSGHQTQVKRNGKTREFVNEKAKMVDFHAIGVQFSEGLKLGQTQFEFYMQTSDAVKHYFFEVKGKEVVDTQFGPLETYRIEQTRKKNRKLVIWFAPEINYQMVKFNYKFNLLDLRGILTSYSPSKL